MLYHCSALSLLFVFAAQGEVIDRIAVIVGKRVIKSSDINRDLRVTAFLNNETLRFTPDVRRKSAERLIDQNLISDQISRGGYAPATAADVDDLMKKLRYDRFGGTPARMRDELARYGLTEEDLRNKLLLQLTVLRFIEQRFRPGVLVTDDEIHAYYDQHIAELRRDHPGNSSFEVLQPEIRNTLEGDRINENLERWLSETRKRSPAEYRQEAFL